MIGYIHGAILIYYVDGNMHDNNAITTFTRYRNSNMTSVDLTCSSSFTNCSYVGNAYNATGARVCQFSCSQMFINAIYCTLQTNNASLDAKHVALGWAANLA